jgi:putative nucleotidyltransferase with HDIG domain
MTPAFRTLRPIARFYVALVISAGAFALGHSVSSLFSNPVGLQWLLLAALTVVTGLFNLKVPSINAYLSVSDAFVFASILIFGTAAGTATALIDCLVISLRMRQHRGTLYRLLFNASATSFAIWASGTAFYSLSTVTPYVHSFTPLASLWLPFLIFVSSHFLMNSFIVALAIALEKRLSIVTVWWHNFAWLSLSYFGGAYVAAVIVTYSTLLDVWSLSIVLPLVVVSYLTFRIAMGRAQDKFNHLAELNRLYLSTIETLAMAIDAKDQITHGHIRRVQAYAVGLAKHMGVSDDKLLKAIEAAALLHDMGKLAVPEHILNKPGKLTPAEFEKMKLHASVGADILSSIDFPYPVVPIVRHHHENWNGRGYPDGIHGTDIPIGARILAVVDCFDALTSDRPYRPRLGDEEALSILKERRGSMYDPLVVDTFVRVYKTIGPLDQPESSRAPLSKLTKLAPAREHRSNHADLIDVASAVLPPTLARDLAAQRDLDGMADVLARCLSSAVPFSLFVLYRYAAETDELVSNTTHGSKADLVKNLRIPRGERLTGWVAANHECIVDSDPVLDLGDIVQTAAGPLRSALSVPIISGTDLVGVVTLYSTSRRYEEADCHLLEAAVACFARCFAETSFTPVS